MPRLETWGERGPASQLTRASGRAERIWRSKSARRARSRSAVSACSATASRSVTIWAKDALTADAIDDAVFILGVEKGMALVDKIEDCGAVIVDADNKVFVSPRLKGVLQLLRPPTDGI